MKRLLILVLVFYSFCVHPQNQQVYELSSSNDMDPENPGFIQDEVIIKFKDHVIPEIDINDGSVHTSIRSLDDLFIQYRITKAEKVFPAMSGKNKTFYIKIQGETTKLDPLYNIYKFKFDKSSNVEYLAVVLGKDPNIDYAEPNYIVYSIETYPNDPIYITGAQWHIDSINAPKAYDLTTSDTNQIIAILDTGIDWDHPDLTGNIWYNYSEIPGNGIDDDLNGYIDDIRGWDFVNLDNNPDDDNSHGTHVAGIAAAVTNNSLGVAGIAWNARLMPVKMLQSTGQGNSADFASAIFYAYQNGATVINMSVGSYGESLTVKNALEYAYSTSMLVAAAGNNFYNLDLAPMYPACYSFVIGVEATDYYGDLALFSNFDIDGPYASIHSDLLNYEIRAPGYGIYSTFPNGNYHALSGTSMSTPIISGAIALMKSYYSVISHEQIFVRLIQGTDNSLLDIYNSLVLSPAPELTCLKTSIIDTLSGCDNDGIADAGETILLNFDIKNYGGYADSVWARLRFGQYEDTTVATIIDSLSNVGDISAYASLGNEQDPFSIKIKKGIAHNRDIVFEYIISASNTDTITQPIIINVQNAKELLGVMDSTMYLTPDKLWLVNGSFRVGSNGHLIMLPGTNIILNAPVVNWGHVQGHGTPDSMINVYGPSVFDIGYYDLSYVHSYPGSTKPEAITYEQTSSFAIQKAQCYVSNCIFDGAVNFYLHNAYCQDCIFKNCGLNNWSTDTITRCNFYNIGYGLRLFSGSEYVSYCTFSNIHNNNIIYGGNKFYKNNFITNLSTTSYYGYNGGTYYQIPPQYWGTSDTSIIDQMIIDFYDNFPNYAIVLYQPILTTPSDSAHGFAWKIHINDLNPQNNNLDPLGVETAKFDVFFNRPMDTLTDPQLSFGVRSPYNQHIVSRNSSWSIDSMIWTAYYDINLETGDGLNYLRVQDAVDDEGLEIPVEDNKRFFFTIQAAGAQSISFTASAGIGRSELNWEKANTSDVIGYNMYRFTNITDTTYGDTNLINNKLITDTSYIDYDVLPDTTYHYLYKIVGTDLAESDFSKKVSCKPMPASDGDANGDGEINVLDITTTVAYMLHQNPWPFLFSAADVNHDHEINVLDIIGLVQLISVNKTVPLTALVDVSDVPAYYEITKGKLVLQSDGNVAGLQFIIEDKRQKDKDRSFATNLQAVTCHLQQLKIFSLQKGFEFTYAPVGDRIIGILYSLNDKVLPQGDIPLFRMEGSDKSQLEISDIFGGDLNGNYVPILRKGQQISQDILADYDLRVQPNPFREAAEISWQLAQKAEVNISIYSLQGEKISDVFRGIQEPGSYCMNWGISNHEYPISNTQLQPGVYICYMVVKPAAGREITKDVKMVIMR